MFRKASRGGTTLQRVRPTAKFCTTRHTRLTRRTTCFRQIWKVLCTADDHSRSIRRTPRRHHSAGTTLTEWSEQNSQTREETTSSLRKTLTPTTRVELGPTAAPRWSSISRLTTRRLQRLTQPQRPLTSSTRTTSFTTCSISMDSMKRPGTSSRTTTATGGLVATQCRPIPRMVRGLTTPHSLHQWTV